jgi:hypothetical protein
MRPAGSERKTAYFFLSSLPVVRFVRIFRCFFYSLTYSLILYSLHNDSSGEPSPCGLDLREISDPLDIPLSILEISLGFENASESETAPGDCSLKCGLDLCEISDPPDISLSILETTL